MNLVADRDIRVQIVIICKTCALPTIHAKTMEYADRRVKTSNVIVL